MTHTVIEADGLGLRYGRRGDWALRDCTFRLRAGRVCALVGPNGSGKSTLLSLAARLLRPTEGTLRTATPEALAYVGQDKPLYPQLTIAETLRMGRELNPGRWDTEAARRIVEGGELDPRARVRTLSGGQRTRVALALALGKRPSLLLLDEPMADLDPLARHRLMGALMADAAENGTTVVMSSHILAELEGACDHLLLVDKGRIRLCGPIEEIQAAHRLLTGPAAASAELAAHTVVESRAMGRRVTALVRPRGPVDGRTWEAAHPSLEELLLAHLRAPDAPSFAVDDSLAGAGVRA
ncbi:ABC-2 type transport system ATP-binding protein [Streptomyces sp. 2132.2]|uniref:ABC transporter ATP-binding protein n=1 Tax=Streptomyces sp. 2132.2 TaxID=2485161 RepID=UPI000F48EF05|nr:ABC transporter ATP-binding protein [Streptomyces sp. 2132.2]ROQ97553.1 ABC-2 type transport system ATP-binding protein [Streptomyces sp. 2132.2]